ncbi:hypothetical protein [Streptomyces hygroscopicus]|uniref:hypothetical protein n=1 Tax=Streptomyces hygroscopicus TaxID=1912 RepID=UPI00369E912C
MQSSDTTPAPGARRTTAVGSIRRTGGRTTTVRTTSASATGTITQTCKRHPRVGRFMATCPGCAQELHDLQYGTPKPDPRTAARARTAIGVPGATLREWLGETATRIAVWSLHELDAIAARHPGRLTRRQVTRTLSDGTAYETIEVTLSVRHDDFVNPIEVVTDWDEDLDTSGLSIAARLGPRGSVYPRCTNPAVTA